LTETYAVVDDWKASEDYLMPILLPLKDSYTFGVISDTHGHIPQRALQAFAGVDAILHAGDIGSQRILQQLATVAPVLAVRGNMDGGVWADGLAEYEVLNIGKKAIHLIHDRLRLRREAVSASCLAVVSGHTHRAEVMKKNGVLHINPGSAGAPRWGEQPCVALIRVKGAAATVEIISIAE
jgi:putative phosphoesterase